MGSSGESNTHGIDAAVGGLVWVRRRNGSWWPGRIMGLDELSESCLVSPRSGTPVKLLGREDASVDWYNLEKSKRVKAFRCPENNECIERAKAAAANTNKKAVKYARREDAILHALELESARLGKKLSNFCSGTEKSHSEQDSSARESPIMSHSHEDDDDLANDVSGSEENSNSALELTQSGISFEDPQINSSPKVQHMQVRRRRTPNDSEDDGTEVVKRMRGLEDLGTGRVSKRHVQVGWVPELVQQGGVSLCNSNSDNFGTAVNGGKGCSSTLRRKRSQMANVHEFLKRKNRRRTLTKVLESTAMVPVPVICDQLPYSSSSPLCGIPDGKVSRLESTESEKSVPMAVANNSDSTGISCENGASSNAVEQGCDASYNGSMLKENETSSITVLPENDPSDKLFDVPFVGVLGEENHATGFSPIFVPCSLGRPQVGSLVRQSCLHGQQSEAVSLVNEGLDEYGSSNSAAGYVNVICHRSEKGTSKWQSKGKRNSRHKNKNRRQVLRKCVNMDSETSTYLEGIENSDGFFQGDDQKIDCSGTGGLPVPYNSTSLAKCKPVVEGQIDGLCNLSKRMRGMTAQVKLLPDGSLAPQRSLPHHQHPFVVNSRYDAAEFLGSNTSSDASLYDVKLEVKASYRPQYVPLVSLVSKLNGKAIVGHPLTIGVLDDGHCDQLLSTMKCDNHVCDKTVKLLSLCQRKRDKRPLPLQQSHFSSNRSSKHKKSGLLSKKTRKLSSLNGHKLSEDEKKPVVDKLMGPVIACIPLKVVFSRINEAVNGTARTTHCALPTTNP